VVSLVKLTLFLLSERLVLGWFCCLGLELSLGCGGKRWNLMEKGKIRKKKVKKG